ncbi:MAG: DMT family transporter, partial [Clostridia bacterium]|nr:DMT family transporter [Clostridia bacterium]
CVGLIHTGLAYCLYFSSLKDMKGQEVAVMSYIDPLVAVIASVAILREPISPLEIIGGLLILGAALINEINFKKK